MSVLPDESGFSFIDQGRVRVKLFHKRSPKSIELYEPLYNINTIEWIDNDRFYLSAKEGNNSKIFQVTMSGSIDCIVSSDGADCMYPQKMQDVLFFVQRMPIKSVSIEKPFERFRYQIMCMSYPKIEHKKMDLDDPAVFDAIVQKLLNDKENKQKVVGVSPNMEILNFENTPIAFLQMVSHQEGYVLEHPPFIESKNKSISFAYYRITKKKYHWQSEQLFSFEIPAVLLLSDSPNRLYESILPLLPKKIGDYIYFVDCSNTIVSQHLNLNVFCYDLTTQVIKQNTFATKQHEHYFVPHKIGHSLFYGGTVIDQSHVKQWIDEESGICVKLPSL